jgi:hypothetical protein
MNMANDTINLDRHRGMTAQKSVENRRYLHQIEADRLALRRRQEKLERSLLTAPAMTWPEAAAKARYLIELFAETAEAQYPRRRELIASALEDLTRLSDGVGELL